MNDLRNRRILLVDDNPAIHDDFRKILAPDDSSGSGIDQEAEALFGGERLAGARFTFTLDSAFQGQEAFEKVQNALAVGEPHTMAFVDMRMPPGWDGLETIRRLWQIHPDLETVICTAYSDHSWQQIQQTLGATDRLLILKKPFDKIEVQQLALTLTEKWNLRTLARLHTDGLTEMVRMRTAEMMRAHRSKSEFLTNVHHELLTPMNGILGITHVLRSTPLNEEQASLLADLQQSGERLHGLINTMLQFNSVEAGRLQLESMSFELGAVCQASVESHLPRAQAKGLRLTTQFHHRLPSRVQGYPDHIKQVLSLLIDNAVKFSDSGTIEVVVRPAVTLHHIEFRIVDQGCGIPPERQAFLNHPFSQGESGPTRNGQGIGMGLTLTRQLVNAMGGWMEFRSKPGEGSTFCFTLPLAEAKQAAAA